jgi:hypothetical protein
MNFFKFLNLNSYKERRLQQLQQEKHIDEQLSKMKKDCPEKAVEYLLKFRKLNRDTVFKIHSYPTMDYAKGIEELLDAVDGIQSVVIDCEWEGDETLREGNE